MSQEDNS